MLPPMHSWMGGLAVKAGMEKEGGLKKAPREDSTSKISLVWQRIKEKLSGAHRLPEASAPGKMLAPCHENEESRRAAAILRIDAARNAMHRGSPFWEYDVESIMERAREGFDCNGDRNDHINQEICARMLGLSIEMFQEGKLGLFAKAGGAEYLKWGEKNLPEAQMRELCGKLLMKIAQLP
ncbi:MAG: hypothetical protein QXH30_02650 [Candidatus Bilamarchaeaceae archaeon]